MLEASLSSTALQASKCSIDKICRLCGTELQENECSQSENDVFRVDYAEKILKCTSLKVEQGDGLPRKICIECITNLNRSYNFRNICIDTYVFLKRFTCSQSLDTNSVNSNIHSTEKMYTERNIDLEVDDQRVNARREKQVGYRFTKKTQESNLCSSQSSVPVNEDTVEDYCQVFKMNSIEDAHENDEFQNKEIGPYDLVSWDENITTEVKGERSFSHRDGWEDESVEKKVEKPMFNLSYPTMQRFMKKAKQDIAEYMNEGGTEVLCPFCPCVFDVEMDHSHLLEHLDSHNHPIIYKYECRYNNCHEVLESPKIRLAHEGTDHGTQKWIKSVIFCDHCAEMVDPSSYGIHKGKRQRKRYEKLECDECSYRTRDKQRLIRHIKGIHELQHGKCKLCKAMIPINQLDYHLTNEHRAKIPCGYCNKEFLPRNIKGHLRTHTGEKPFSCADCGLEFTFRVSLKTHKKKYQFKDLMSNVINSNLK